MKPKLIRKNIWILIFLVILVNMVGVTRVWADDATGTSTPEPAQDVQRTPTDEDIPVSYTHLTLPTN